MLLPHSRKWYFKFSIFEDEKKVYVKERVHHIWDSKKLLWHIFLYKNFVYYLSDVVRLNLVWLRFRNKLMMSVECELNGKILSNFVWSLVINSGYLTRDPWGLIKLHSVLELILDYSFRILRFFFSVDLCENFQRHILTSN